MDCRTCMSPVKTPLYSDQPAGSVIDFMREHHMEMVPIVDRENNFVGLLSAGTLMRMLLPRSISMMRGIKHASYLRESPQELRQRMDEIRDKTLADLVTPYAKTVHPDAALADALMAITEQQFIVPVVDDDNKLVGAISYFSIMHAVDEEVSKEGDAA